MKNSIRSGMLIRIFGVLFAVAAVVLFVFYEIGSAYYENNEYIPVKDAACFAAVEVNGDKARTYVKTMKTDSEYQDVLRSLIQYTQISTVNRISVISYANTVGYYIYDTEGKTIGTKVSYDVNTTEIKSLLVECRETREEVRGDTVYYYRPLRTADDLAVGYIIVESSVVNERIPMGIIIALLLTAVGLFGISLVISWRLNVSIFNRVREYTKAAASFAGMDIKNSKDDIRRKFETGSNDEIGRLGNALIEMINVINNSKSDVMTAVFDATHDGMTKAFNKRHYENKVAGFHNLTSIMVVYFDVNNLKLMNDTLGHERGDYVIIKAAEYIESVSSEISTGDCMCFRMGGDEFLLVIQNLSNADKQKIVNRLDDDCPHILSAETDSIKCSVAYGCAYDLGNRYVYENLLSEAEEEMYRKKYQIKQQLNMPDR